jgi:hypothetical protein
MSYQLLNEMEEWEEDTDVLLHHLPIVGCAFRKVYRSETLGRNKSEMVPAIHLVVNNKCRSLDEAPAVTHEVFIYPQDIEERKLSGTFLDIDLPAPVPPRTATMTRTRRICSLSSIASWIWTRTATKSRISSRFTRNRAGRPHRCQLQHG